MPTMSNPYEAGRTNHHAAEQLIARGAATLGDVPPVQLGDRLESLEQSVACAAERIARLRERLRWVLAPESPTAVLCGGRIEPRANCPAVQKIDAIQDAMANLDREIHDVLARLAI